MNENKIEEVNVEEEKKLKIAVVLFSVFYLIIGLANFIWGASKESRFYEIDDIVVRLIGFILIGSSIGALFKVKAARVGFIVALGLSLVEIFVFMPAATGIFEYAVAVYFILMICLPGLIYFSVVKELTK